MTLSALRTVLRLTAVACIPGVIAGSIAENNAVVFTFGAMIGVAGFGLIVLTAATSSSGTPDGEVLEERIAGLVDAGADEDDVRALVRDAVRFGQQQQNS